MRKKGGYGVVFQTVMRNKNLSPEAKAIYAYLCCFTDSNDSCYPSVDTMQEELGMSKGRFLKYMHELTACGVVECSRSFNGNLLGRNIYKISHNVEIPEKRSFKPVENREVGNRGVGFRTVGNQPPNNTSTNNTSINNTSNNIYVCSEPETDSTPETDKGPFPPEADGSALACTTGIRIILNDKSYYDVPADKLPVWEEAYPAVDVMAELRKMAAWSESNPTKRKTRRGVNAFINGWLSREQDRGGGSRQQKTEAKEAEEDAARGTTADFYKRLLSGARDSNGDLAGWY